MSSKTIKKFRWVIWRIRKKLANHLSNYPFISGNNFVKECDLEVTVTSINDQELIKNIEASKSIFVEGHLLYEFVEKFKEFLSDKVIISGNSDCNIVYKPNFSSMPSAVLLQNSTIPADEIFRTVPIGLENISHARSGFKILHRERNSFEILDRVLLPPMSPTNEVRKKVLVEALERNDIFDVQVGFRSPSKYFRLVRRYKFVFVCEGNGFDTHRLWEVLYQNSYPVLIETPWAKSLEWLKLPILFVPDLRAINVTRLEEHHREFADKRPSDYPQLWMPFWQRLIESKTKSEN